MKTLKLALVSVLAVLLVSLVAAASDKPKLSLEDCFNSVGLRAEISPDGGAVVIQTERADWDQQIFRSDLWLYRVGSGTLLQLTHSGHDSEPKWSPDGRWIVFLSERKVAASKSGDSEDKTADKESSQLYLISPNGGEAFALTAGDDDIHSFTWSADSRRLYFSTRTPWTKAQTEDYKKEWKDVVQYRESERGDTIYELEIAAAIANHESAPAKETADSDKETVANPEARTVAISPLRVENLVTSPDGAKLAFTSSSINQREEKFEDFEIYTVGLKEHATAPHRVTSNLAQEISPRWAADSRHILFSVEVGDVSGPYRDLQPHLYWVDSETGVAQQWGKDFVGMVANYTVSPGGLLLTARLGTEVQVYSAAQPADSFRKLAGWDGTYEDISTAQHSSRVAFVYSALDRPSEVYLAESADKLQDARPITSFNKLYTERALPQGKPYRWKADDGTAVEGMLIYPPGKFEAKHLPVFVFIHGGPADADGNHFETDWYQWAVLAATNGWLVFEPNYRGSTGYGDKFLSEIVPVIVSRPGKDILEGVDALVKDGIADADHLAVGGYSYGGYMTNWLITQTTRFKAAVTGAGAVENVGNWGNDDTTFDDAYSLGGRPWEAAQRYHDEAAIFQMDKVRTPTHMVAGADDIRVAVLEDYLMEHALTSLGVPNKLLIFPGEGHGLGKNPWHGRIKVREELKWLQKYGGVAGN